MIHYRYINQLFDITWKSDGISIISRMHGLCMNTPEKLPKPQNWAISTTKVETGDCEIEKLEHPTQQYIPLKTIKGF